MLGNANDHVTSYLFFRMQTMFHLWYLFNLHLEWHSLTSDPLQVFLCCISLVLLFCVRITELLEKGFALGEKSLFLLRVHGCSWIRRQIHYFRRSDFVVLDLGCFTVLLLTWGWLCLRQKNVNIYIILRYKNNRCIFKTK